MSDVLIRYDNKGVPVTGTGPTPYVSLSDQVLNYGDKWGLAQNITLNGQITGCTYQDLYEAQTGLVGVFENSYKNLEVFEGADGQNNQSEVFSFSGCSVNDISFSQASYNSVVNYSVNLTSYPSGYTGYFSSAYGVLDPVDNISIAEGEDGFGTLNRQVSARGFVTSTVDAAVNNAKNYVQSRTGVAEVLSVSQVSGFENSGSFTPVLVSVAENLDRLSLTYSVEESYRFSMVTGDVDSPANYSFNNYFITDYSTNLSSGAGEDFVKADVQGQIKAGITGDSGANLVSALIEKLELLDPYSIVSGKYGQPNSLEFCRDPLSYSTSYNEESRSLSFNISYDNLDFYSNVDDRYVVNGSFLDATISHSIDELTKTTEIIVQGNIRSRGSSTEKYNDSLEYLGQLLSDSTPAGNTSAPRIFDFANDYYTSFFTAPIKFSLNEKPTSLIVNAEPLLGEVSISAKFDNKDRFGNTTDTNFEINYVPYNTAYSYGFSCNDAKKQIAVDANVKRREKASINLSIQDTNKVGADLITGVFNFSSGDFHSDFILPLALDETVQQENSTLNTTDISYEGGEEKTNAKVSLNETYSYELSSITNRAIIKST